MYLLFFANHWEIWIILFVILLLFGNRIPTLARSLGSGITEFRKGLKGDEDNNKKSADDHGAHGHGTSGQSGGAGHDAADHGAGSHGTGGGGHH